MLESSKDLITIISSITGMVLGTAGFVLSLVNFFRDHSKIKVNLKWDLSVMPGDDPRFDPRKKYALISVSNIGRRPVYLSSVSLRVPKGKKWRYMISSESAPKGQKWGYLLSLESVQGKKLEEGGPPALIPMSQDDLEEFAKQWRDVRAYVEVSTGKTYLSKKHHKGQPPDWAKKGGSGS